MRALAVALVFVPTVVLAQSPAPIAPAPAPIAPAPMPPGAAAAPMPGAEPAECVTTTTVRCTGAAAPYAVQAAQPQPVVVPAPAPQQPIVAPAPLRPTIVLDPRALRGGWHLVQSPEGCLWRERKVSSDSPAVWGTGLAFWLGSYFIGAGVAQTRGNPLLWWPIIGALTTSSFTTGNDQVLSAIDGVVQAGGFVTFLVGLAAGPDKIERMPLSIGPMAVAGAGSGLALAGHF